jgi:hypothetical protein
VGSAPSSAPVSLVISPTASGFHSPSFGDERDFGLSVAPESAGFLSTTSDGMIGAGAGGGAIRVKWLKTLSLQLLRHGTRDGSSRYRECPLGFLLSYDVLA